MNDGKRSELLKGCKEAFKATIAWENEK